MRKCCEFCKTDYSTKSHMSKYCSSTCGKLSKIYVSYEEYSIKKIKQPIQNLAVPVLEDDDIKYTSKYEYWSAGNVCTTITNPTLRRYLKELYGAKCSCCGISNWNNKEITLEVEHIDGNSSNNLVNNVCLLCPNCHSQTSTYKGRNKGKGRQSRMQRYLDGKSY